MGYLSLSHMATWIHAISNHWRDRGSNPDPLTSLPAIQELSHYTIYNCIQEGISVSTSVNIAPPPPLTYPFDWELVLNLSPTDTIKTYYHDVHHKNSIGRKSQRTTCSSLQAKFPSPRDRLTRMQNVIQKTRF